MKVLCLSAFFILKNKVQKEDYPDCRKIARSLRSSELSPIYIPSENTLDNLALVRTHSVLIMDITRFKLQIKSFLYFYGIIFLPELERKNTHWSDGS